MKTLRELEELELMQHQTGLRGEALLDYFDAHRDRGQSFIQRHQQQRSAASYCAEIDKYLAEMRFFRNSGYATSRPCLATLRDIQRIEKAHGDPNLSVNAVVSVLVEQMERQQKALA